MAAMAETQSPTEAMIEAHAFDAKGWSAGARADALARLRAAGLPQRRDEYWKYTRPTTLTQVTPRPAAPMTTDEAPLFDGIDSLQIVFVDGVFDASASDDLAMEGVRIDRLATATSDIHWARDIYGALESRGQNPVVRPLATLNTGLAQDGVLVHVTGKPAKPIHLVYRQVSEASDVILHHCIKVDAGAEATILESGSAGARFNTVMEAEIADKSVLHHVRIQGRDHDRRALTHIFARLGTETQFKSFTLTVNGVLTRNEAILELVGDDGVAHVAGASVGDGDFHDDDTIFITHDAVNCESRQVFKKVLRNGAVGVFQGKILVKEGAQKTDGYQISQSLLLDDDSQFLAKPELEIYADDVACSHGSTSGAIDEDALFYLRARGVPEGIATDMLTLSFLAEAVEEIESEALKDEINARLEAWLARRRD